jgi:Flp pilus assembly protein TadD
MEDELARLHVQSATLHDQMTLLAAPAVELTDQERALFKDAELVVSDQGGDNLTASISAPLSGAAITNASATTTTTNAGQKLPGVNEQGAAESSDAAPALDKKVQAGTNAAASSAVLPWQGKFKELLTQAKEEFDRQDYLEAENSFQESLKLSPNDYFALSNLGVVEFQLGKMKEAEESLKKASEQSKDNSFALTTLGIVHYRQMRLADAEKVLRKSIAVNNQDFTAHNYLGIVLAASGNGKAGESEIMKAIEINPNYADAHFNLAVIYATGKPPAKMMARQHYNKALELGSPPDASLEHLLE